MTAIKPALEAEGADVPGVRLNQAQEEEGRPGLYLLGQLSAGGHRR